MRQRPPTQTITQARDPDRKRRTTHRPQQRNHTDRQRLWSGFINLPLPRQTVARDSARGRISHAMHGAHFLSELTSSDQRGIHENSFRLINVTARGNSRASPADHTLSSPSSGGSTLSSNFPNLQDFLIVIISVELCTEEREHTGVALNS